MTNTSHCYYLGVSVLERLGCGNVWLLTPTLSTFLFSPVAFILCPYKYRQTLIYYNN